MKSVKARLEDTALRYLEDKFGIRLTKKDLLAEIGLFLAEGGYADIQRAQPDPQPTPAPPPPPSRTSHSTSAPVESNFSRKVQTSATFQELEKTFGDATFLIEESSYTLPVDALSGEMATKYYRNGKAISVPQEIMDAPKWHQQLWIIYTVGCGWVYRPMREEMFEVSDRRTNGEAKHQRGLLFGFHVEHKHIARQNALPAYSFNQNEGGPPSRKAPSVDVKNISTIVYDSGVDSESMDSARGEGKRIFGVLASEYAKFFADTDS